MNNEIVATHSAPTGPRRSTGRRRRPFSMCRSSPSTTSSLTIANGMLSARSALARARAGSRSRPKLRERVASVCKGRRVDIIECSTGQYYTRAQLYTREEKLHEARDLSQLQHRDPSSGCAPAITGATSITASNWCAEAARLLITWRLQKQQLEDIDNDALVGSTGFGSLYSIFEYQYYHWIRIRCREELLNPKNKLPKQKSASFY